MGVVFGFPRTFASQSWLSLGISWWSPLRSLYTLCVWVLSEKGQ